MSLVFSVHDQLPRPETVAVVKWWAGHLRAFTAEKLPESLSKQYQGKPLKLFRIAQGCLTPKNIATFEEVGVRELDAKLSELGESQYTISINLNPDRMLFSWLSKAQIGLVGVIAFPIIGYSVMTRGKVLVCASMPENPGKEIELALK